ncbi:hypothetical protein FRB94_005397 [Tulasnella sp. JGI-2019a]|nr:hypothetical protein FRB94_005397 [Tulasnella sp. JGI-2019a]KAG9038060.1 hypothetical protein FRB95_002988 [Tulasnella sp. JGI-2019a]
MVIGTLAGMQLRASWRWEPTFHTCYVGKNPWTFWVWLPAVPLETVIFGLTILKAIRYTKENFKMPVTRLLYRDGALFFVVITSLSITNLTTWSLLPPTLTYLTRFCSFAIVTTMSSRLVLNLRSLGREEDPWLTDLSVMQFQLTAPNQSYSYWDPYLHDLDMDFDLVDDATRATWADPYTSMTALHDTASRRSRWSRSGSDGRRAGRGFYRTSSLLSPDWATEMRVPDRVRLSRMPSRSASLLETMDSRDEF